MVENMKKINFFIFSFVIFCILALICYVNYDYMSYCIDKATLKPISFINRYAKLEIPIDAEIKSYYYVKSFVDDERVEVLQTTVIVPKEQVNYILYGQSTVPVLTEEERLSEEPITPEDIAPMTLEEFDINIQDVEIYRPKGFTLQQTPFWGASRLSRDIDIIVTKADDENMREIHIEIDNLGWGRPIK